MMEKLPEWKEYPATMEMYHTVRDDIMQEARTAGVSAEGVINLELGVEEMLVNIIKYAYDEPGSVWVRARREDIFFRVDFADHGRRFNPLEEKNRGGYEEDDFEEGGMGILLVRNNFDKIEYKYDDFRGQGANILSLWLKIG